MAGTNARGARTRRSTRGPRARADRRLAILSRRGACASRTSSTRSGGGLIHPRRTPGARVLEAVPTCATRSGSKTLNRSDGRVGRSETRRRSHPRSPAPRAQQPSRRGQGDGPAPSRLRSETGGPGDHRGIGVEGRQLVGAEAIGVNGQPTSRSPDCLTVAHSSGCEGVSIATVVAPLPARTRQSRSTAVAEPLRDDDSTGVHSHAAHSRQVGAQGDAELDPSTAVARSRAQRRAPPQGALHGPDPGAAREEADVRRRRTEVEAPAGRGRFRRRRRLCGDGRNHGGEPWLHVEVALGDELVIRVGDDPPGHAEVDRQPAGGRQHGAGG